MLGQWTYLVVSELVPWPPCERAWLGGHLVRYPCLLGLTLSRGWLAATDVSDRALCWYLLDGTARNAFPDGHGRGGLAWIYRSEGHTRPAGQ
jgi:hypothetical protein